MSTLHFLGASIDDFTFQKNIKKDEKIREILFVDSSPLRSHGRVGLFLKNTRVFKKFCLCVLTIPKKRV